jgi:hypothetical protein
MARFRLGTEQALEQADILKNPDITLIQALVIYLSVLQHTGEAKLAWFLAGLLERIAVSMNLHLDGSKLDRISPFEVETRRRLWWQNIHKFPHSRFHSPSSTPNCPPTTMM